jgi:peptidoglycan/xylan/chitin deacetylase (PgdA/CDA1 family)
MKATLLNGFKHIAGMLEGHPHPPAHALEVVAMHSTPADRLDDFRQLVHHLSGIYRPFDPALVPAYFTHPSDFKEGPYLIFTFDDGLANNLASARILAEAGHKAIYFLVPEFHMAGNSEVYYRTFIRPVVDELVDHQHEDRTALTVDQIGDLTALGHHIGCHTKTHRLHAGMSPVEVYQEIAGGRQTLGSLIGREVDYFASPNDTFFSVNRHAARVIREHYRAHFVTFPGHNHLHGNAQMVFRRNIEVHWSMGRIKYAMGAWDLWRWRQAKDRFEALLLPPEG